MVVVLGTLSPQTVAFASGVMEKLGQPGHYTLFAPSNRAFEKLGAGYLERIMGDKKIISGSGSSVTFRNLS